MNVLKYFITCYLTFCHLHSSNAGEYEKQAIVNGELTQPGEIKYIVATLHANSWYGCGGGIIDDYFVLTAAHCFYDDKDRFENNKITIVAGTNDLNNRQDPRRIEVDVEKIYIPSNYDHSTYPNDIAVLKLKKSLNIEKNDLQKLLLPTKDRNLTDRTALMAGFGIDKYRLAFNRETYGLEREGSTSGHLRKADIKIFGNDECQSLYKEKIYDSYLCGKMMKWTLIRKYGVCNGDSGSPLVYNSKVLVGVVSWSYGCDERKVPLIYTRVTSFIKFIENAMKDKTKNMFVKTFK